MVIPLADGDGANVAPSLLSPPEPLDGFTSEEFRARRAALRSSCPDGIVLIRGATESDSVNHGAYLQNSDFFYLTGVDTPGAFLVLLPQGVAATSGLRDAPAHLREFLFLPARNPRMETYNGPNLGRARKRNGRQALRKSRMRAGSGAP